METSKIDNEKTIRLYYRQLKREARRRLILNAYTPYNLRLSDFERNCKKNIDFEYYLDLGYKVVFHYFNKDYLMIYNK